MYCLRIPTMCLLTETYKLIMNNYININDSKYREVSLFSKLTHYNDTLSLL